MNVCSDINPNESVLSNESTFFFLMNKSLLLIHHVDKKIQKETINNLQTFVQKLLEIYQDEKHSQPTFQKKKLLDAMSFYFHKLIDKLVAQISPSKDILLNIDEICKKKCEAFVKDKSLRKIEKSVQDQLETSQKKMTEILQDEEYKPFHCNDKIIDNPIEKTIDKQDLFQLEKKMFISEQKIYEKIRTVFLEIENNVKQSLKEYVSHYERIDKDFDKKVEAKLQANNAILEKVLSKLCYDLCTEKVNSINFEGQIQQLSETYMEQICQSMHEYIESKQTNLEIKLQEKIQNIITVQQESEKDSKERQKELSQKIQYLTQFLLEKKDSFVGTKGIQASQVQELVEEYIYHYEKKEQRKKEEFEQKFEKKQNDIKQSVQQSFGDKIEQLTRILNNHFQQVIEQKQEEMKQSQVNEKDVIHWIEEYINVMYSKKSPFQILFDKESNDICLFYNNQLISNTKLNIKGLIGPKGPQGQKGEKGDTPIIRNIFITPDNKLKFTVQDSENIYDIVSNNDVPKGPPGIQGERGLPGKTIVDFQWKQQDFMRYDEDQKDSIVFLKSMCVGEKSICLKNDSLSVAGGTTYQTHSMAIGNNSKTLGSHSVALFGSTIGNNAFAYRADNVDENSIQFGKKDKNQFNIQKINLNSKEVSVDCDIFNLNAKEISIPKFKELEEKICYLEKKVLELSKKM